MLYQYLGHNPLETMTEFVEIIYFDTQDSIDPKDPLEILGRLCSHMLYLQFISIISEIKLARSIINIHEALNVSKRLKYHSLSYWSCLSIVLRNLIIKSTKEIMIIIADKRGRLVITFKAPCLLENIIYKIGILSAWLSSCVISTKFGCGYGPYPMLKSPRRLSSHLHSS